jgi:hypothetical protein
MQQNDFTRAAAILGEVVAYLRARDSADPRNRAALSDVLAELTDYLLKDRRIEEADDAISEALAIDVALHGEHHGQTLLHRGKQLDVIARRLPIHEVEAELRALLAGKRAFFGDRHPHTVAAMIALVPALERTGRADEAVAVATEAAELSRLVDGPLSLIRMNVYMRSLWYVTLDEVVVAIVADAQRTVREGLATGPEVVRFFLTFTAKRDSWRLAREFARRALEQPGDFSLAGSEEAARMVADVVEASRPPGWARAARARHETVDLALQHASDATLRTRLTQLVELCRPEPDSPGGYQKRQGDREPPGLPRYEREDE